jgi:cytochrome c2
MRYVRHRIWLLLGACLAVASVIGPRAAAPAKPRPMPAANEPSSLPLIGACGAILAACAFWFAIQAWMQASTADAVARAMTGGNPRHAPALLTRYGCAGCHTIPDVPGADGQVGGSLGGISKRVFIAGVLPNTADNLIDWIVRPQRYSSRSAMPETGISREEARDVAAWLYAR